MSSGNFKIHNSIPTPVFAQGLKDASLDKLEVRSINVNIPTTLTTAPFNVYRLAVGQYIASASVVVSDDIGIATGQSVVLSFSNTATTAGTDYNTFTGVLNSIAVNAVPVVNVAYTIPRVADLSFVNLRATSDITSPGKVNVTLIIVNT